MTTPSPSPFLIVTADDFGLHEAVNEAVEQANREGVLTAASLMVNERAAQDAVRRAKALPGLRVGLHLVLADGLAACAPSSIADLVDEEGWMDDGMATRGLKYFALPRVRLQLEKEIRAQFCAFLRTGLPLDHVNVHKHFHMHPTILGMIIRIGRDHGLQSVRLPLEPSWFARRKAARLTPSAALFALGARAIRRRLDAAHIFHNDHLFGIAASGSMNEESLLAVMDRLPPGVTEIYLHPATQSGGAIAPSAPDYAHAVELGALLSPRVSKAVNKLGILCGGFADARRHVGRAA